MDSTGESPAPDPDPAPDPEPEPEPDPEPEPERAPERAHARSETARSRLSTLDFRLATRRQNDTNVGLVWSSSVPSPIWPNTFLPQHFTV